MLCNCPYCGLKLMKTREGKLFCKNCGYVEDLKESENEEPKYVS